MLGDVRAVDPYPYQRREARERVTRVFVGDLSEEKLERSDSLFVTEIGAARSPPWPVSSRETPRVTRHWATFSASGPRKTASPMCETSKSPYKTMIGEIKANTD